MGLKELAEREDVGVVVGRFQIHKLHKGHRDIIDSVVERHDAVLIFLGVSPLRHTTSNPLDLKARRALFREAYPDIDVHYVRDCEADAAWSEALDKEIHRHTNPGQTVRLYGSRASFVDHYRGKPPTTVLEAQSIVSATEIRRRVQNNYAPNRDFRAGVIAAAVQREPHPIHRIGVFVLSENRENILMVRLPEEAAWRFPSLESALDTPNLDADASRAVFKQTGIDHSTLHYVGGYQPDDWRYRSVAETVKITFFATHYRSGVVGKYNEGVAIVAWRPTTEVLLGELHPEHAIVHPEHGPAMSMLAEWLETNPSNAR